MNLNKFYNNDSTIEIGVDEVGRGPLLGRVYAAAVILPKFNENFIYKDIKDSKKFSSHKKLTEVANYIKENCIEYSIGYCDELEIDKINIRNATFKAMHMAISNLKILSYKENKEFLIMVDGNSFKPYTYLTDNNMFSEINHICIEKGDNKYYSIAAASILAKVERDNYILELCLKYPQLEEY